MGTDPLYEKFRELSWRRRLTAAEEKQLRDWLSAHPGAQAEWEAEAKLSEMLDRLPDAPVATNFTARVLQAVERDAARATRHGWTRWTADLLRFRWFPRAAVALAVVSAGLLTVHHLQDEQRKGDAKKLVVISDAASLLSADALEDFNYVRVMDPAPGPDDELLKLLQ